MENAFPRNYTSEQKSFFRKITRTYDDMLQEREKLDREFSGRKTFPDQKAFAQTLFGINLSRNSTQKPTPEE